MRLVLHLLLGPGCLRSPVGRRGAKLQPGPWRRSSARGDATDGAVAVSSAVRSPLRCQQPWSTSKGTIKIANTKWSNLHKKKQEEEEKERELKEKEAQKVKLEALEARQRAVTRELTLGPVRASLGSGRRQGGEAPEAAGPPQPGPLCSHHCALQEEKEEEEEEEEAPEVLFLSSDTALWARVPLLLFIVWCAVLLYVVVRP